MSPRPTAHIKAAPEHWRVYEHLAAPLSGEGEHAYFYVEKTQLNTMDVVKLLAQAYQVESYQVGYAGRKDKHAVTRQWFSVPTTNNDWMVCAPELSCLRRARHHRKLRHGVHAHNEFEILLTQCDAEVAERAADFSQLFPNYFGYQRVSDDNVLQAKAWLARSGLGSSGGADTRSTQNAPRRRARGRRGRKVTPQRGWHMSVLRSHLFNEVLARRVAQGNHCVEIEGDVLSAGVPTGPLWGRGKSPVTGLAALVEEQALAPHRSICDVLEFTGLSQARRALVAQAQNLNVESAANEIKLTFSLPPGVYATALLSHTLNLYDCSVHHE